MPQQSPATCQSAAAIGAEVNVWVLGRSLFATLSEAKLTWFGQAESVEDDPFRHFATTICCAAQWRAIRARTSVGGRRKVECPNLLGRHLPVETRSTIRSDYI
jgi:hypothetical protein